MSKNEIPEIINPKSAVDQFQRFVDIVKILRKECPWDRQQTNESIAQLMIEETYECLDEIYKGNSIGIAKELGDLLLHIVLHSVIAEEKNEFNLADVINYETEKMIHRHPHVFGDTEVENSENVVKNWEHLKLLEKRESVLEGVPNSLPQLLRAQRIQHKVSKVGFDWDDKKDVWNKVFEEINELKIELEKGDKQNALMELGDVLFAIVNAARHEGLIAEEGLMFTNNKFTNRFQYIEKKAKEANKKLTDMTLQEMDELWDEAKKNNL